MAKTKVLGALAVVFFLTTATFALLFTWQYLEEKQDDSKSDPDVTTDDCPYYPTPQKLDLNQKEFRKLFDWLDAYVSSTVNITARPSVAANLVYLDHVAWNGYYGKVSKETEDKPNQNTIYRIGSISKVFPVLYLFKLWEEGKVELYDPVTKYAPDFKIGRPLETESKINLIDIASQISGLPGSLPFNPMNESAIVYKGDLSGALSMMKGQILVAEPRSKCFYSNLAYALLGHILERNFTNNNESFTDWARQNVVVPLDLTNTGFSYSSEVIGKMAKGYLPNGAPAPIYELSWYDPAGNYYSTIADLNKLSMSFMETSRTILKHETLTEMMRPRKTCKHGYFANITGSPWEMEILHDNLVVRKDGDIEGYSSTMAMVPNLKLSFTILMSGTRSENVAQKVLERAIPVFRNALRRMEQKVSPTPDVKKYTGVFSFYGLQEQTITTNHEGSLIMVNPKEGPRYNTTSLSFVSDTVFQLLIQGGAFPCLSNMDAQNGAYIHFGNFSNGRFNKFDIPELFIYGFRRLDDRCELRGTRNCMGGSL